MKKKTILSFCLLFLVVGGIIFGLLKSQKKEAVLELEKVSRGNVSQEISETGTVKPAEEIALSFENAGQLKKIYVKENQKIKPNQFLASLDAEQLSLQLSEAEAARDTAKTKLNQLLAGSSPEEIKLAETTLLNAQSVLKDAEQNLEDVKALAEKSLENAYEDALNDLDDAYLKIYNAFYDVDTIQKKYFNTNDQEDHPKVRENKGIIEEAMNRAKLYLDTAKAKPENENIDIALSEMKEALAKSFKALTVIRDICEKPYYYNKVSTTDKDALDTQKTNINTAFSDISGTQQTISLTKIQNGADINSARAKVNQAKGDVQRAEDQLALKKASPRQVDIDLYQAQIAEVETKINLFKNQINRTFLRSPIEGVITDIVKKEGETVKATESVITLISSKPFQLKTDIYEEDIAKVKVLDSVDIVLVAFPEKILTGKVSSVNSAEKLIDGVVYYEVTIDFETLLENLKSGMTADITIKTDSRENVLTIPKASLIEKDNETFVKVLKDDQVEERKIEVGLKGSDNKVEVISGLQEGEEIVLSH